MPLALFFLSQEQSERDFSEGSRDARGGCGCYWTAAAFSLTEGLVRVFISQGAPGAGQKGEKAAEGVPCCRFPTDIKSWGLKINPTQRQPSIVEPV